MKKAQTALEEGTLLDKRIEKIAREFVTGLVVRGGAGHDEMCRILEARVDIEEFIDAATKEFAAQTRMAFEHVSE